MAQTNGRSKQRGGHRALITGASAGIGAAFAQRLARDGHDLLIVARDRRRLDTMAARLQEDYQVRVEVLPADLTDAKELAAVERVVDDNDFDLLVNNAGFGTYGRFLESDPDREESEVRLNIVALMRLTRAALPRMVSRRRGSIINVSSLAAFQPGPYNATYCATKAFVNSFTEALAEELRGSGVYVQALCPGFTRTEFQERAGVDVRHLPEIVWMEADAVVDASLAAMRERRVVVVAGLGNRLVSTVTAAVPRRVLTRVLGMLATPPSGRK